MISTDKNKGYELQAGATEERIHSAVRIAMTTLERGMTATLRSAGAHMISASVVQMPSNSVDSEVKIAVTATTKDATLAYDLTVPFKNGSLILQSHTMIEALDKAKALWASQASNLSETDVETIAVDLQKVTAHREEGIVIYASDELPQWNYITPTDSLKTDIGRKVIASRIIASIRGFTLSDFHRVAAFKQTDFALPIVDEINVKAKLEPAQIPSFTMTASEMEESLTETNMVVHGLKSARSTTPADIQSDRQYAMVSRVKTDCSLAAEAFVRGKLNGGNPKVLNVTAKVKVSAIGMTEGHSDVTIRYYASKSIEEVTLRVPYEGGKINATKIAETTESVTATEMRNADMKVYSETEVSQAFSKYKKEVKAASSQGSNFLNAPAVSQVPVLKALLPAKTKVGDKIELRGFIYEVHATNYNSPDVEHSAYFMLKLTDDTNTGEYPDMGLFANKKSESVTAIKTDEGEEAEEYGDQLSKKFYESLRNQHSGDFPGATYYKESVEGLDEAEAREKLEEAIRSYRHYGGHGSAQRQEDWLYSLHKRIEELTGKPATKGGEANKKSKESAEVTRQSNIKKFGPLVKDPKRDLADSKSDLEDAASEIDMASEYITEGDGKDAAEAIEESRGDVERSNKNLNRAENKMERIPGLGYSASKKNVRSTTKPIKAAEDPGSVSDYMMEVDDPSQQKNGVWVVNVGNIGQIACDDEASARETYKDYIEQSKSDVGRASGESVDLLKDGEPVETYPGTQSEDAE